MSEDEILDPNGLGPLRLTTMVVTTCVGAGIFSLAGDLASGGANTAAILISWLICFVGVFALAKTFCGLSLARPDLKGGIYAYANEGFGDFAGFESAWGYWMSACLNNAGYGVMLFAALGHFFPVFGAGNNLVAIACASAFLWLLVFLLMRGVHVATGVNAVITLAKLVPLALFIVCVALLGRFDLGVFMSNFWGEPGGPALGEQIRSTMISLVWLFVGIEGAVVVSGRARSVRDVSRATISGFVLVIVFYVLISLLSLGIMTREQMAALPTPSLGGVFEQVIGPMGAALINGGVAVSLMGTMLGFLIFASETPYQAALAGIFPSTFSRVNKAGTPVLSTLLSAGITQLFLVLSLFASSTYQFFYNCSVNAILVPYAFSALYYAMIAWRGRRAGSGSDAKKNAQVRGGESAASAGQAASSNASAGVKRVAGAKFAPSQASGRLWGSLAVVYALFLIWSSDLKGVLVMCIALAPGLVAYAITQFQRRDPILPAARDKVLAAALIAGTVAAIVLGWTGAVALV